MSASPSVQPAPDYLAENPAPKRGAAPATGGPVSSSAPVNFSDWLPGVNRWPGSDRPASGPGEESQPNIFRLIAKRGF
jgi:hypothetical protein